MVAKMLRRHLFLAENAVASKSNALHSVSQKSKLFCVFPPCFHLTVRFFFQNCRADFLNFGVRSCLEVVRARLRRRRFPTVSSSLTSTARDWCSQVIFINITAHSLVGVVRARNRPFSN